MSDRVPQAAARLVRDAGGFQPVHDVHQFLQLAAEAEENEDAPHRKSYPEEAEVEVEEVEEDNRDHPAFKLRPIK